MPNRRTPLFAALLSSLVTLAACQPQGTKLIPAQDPDFSLEGRIQKTVTAAPEFVWQASSASIDFTGSSLAFVFSEVEGQAYFDATVDGHTHVIQAANGEIPFPANLSGGHHSLTLAKRTEANAGTARFVGIRIASDADTASRQTRDSKLKLLFFGDSITAGACNEDGEADQWDDRSKHNAMKSYAALAARKMGAVHRNISVSGMGVSTGYTPPTFPEIWNRARPQANAPLADLESYQPDLVFINLGENDDSYTTNQNQPFPQDFAARYLEMLRQMRAAYPDAHFVILRGGMFGGARSPRLIEAWEKVVRAFEAEDANASHFAFTHWTEHHPRVSDAEKMAEEVVNWLRSEKRF